MEQPSASSDQPPMATVVGGPGSPPPLLAANARPPRAPSMATGAAFHPGNAAAAAPSLTPASSFSHKRLHGHESGVSEGPSESSINAIDTEDDDFQTASFERFYEQMAAKAQLRGDLGPGSTQNLMLSLARSYRRLSKDKRRRGLRALQSLAAQGASAALGTTSGSSVGCKSIESTTGTTGWSSNTDDSGYEAGYETDADESELSEWEGANGRRQGHKRKLDALVHLTMQLGLAESARSNDSSPRFETSSRSSMLPPAKTPRALGTQAVGVRLDLLGPRPMRGVSASSTCPGASSSGAATCMGRGSSASAGSSMPAEAWAADPSVDSQMAAGGQCSSDGAVLGAGAAWTGRAVADEREAPRAGGGGPPVGLPPVPTWMATEPATSAMAAPPMAPMPWVASAGVIDTFQGASAAARGSAPDRPVAPGRPLLASSLQCGGVPPAADQADSRSGMDVG